MRIPRNERQGRRSPPRIRSVEVLGTRHLSPNMVAVRFGGHELEGFSIAGPTGHIKVFLPPEGYPEVDLAALALPRGSRPASAPISRTFTPRRFDESTGELEIEFFLHGDGPASTFAAKANSGDRVAISGPSRPYALRPECWQLIAGDETALPAIAMILESLPAHAEGLVLLEISDPRDVPALVERPNIEVRSVVRDAGAPAGSAMVDAMCASAFGTAPVQAWVAGEATGIRRARAALFGRGVSLGLLTTRGYWRYGEAGHPDHDMGED